MILLQNCKLRVQNNNNKHITATHVTLNRMIYDIAATKGPYFFNQIKLDIQQVRLKRTIKGRMFLRFST